LKAKCSLNPDAPKECILPEDQYLNRNVYSKKLTWEPIGEQATLFADDPPRPVHDDILIAKLAPGQELDLKLLCVKGIGRDHAKFSPVCTAFYRFLPTIELLGDIRGEDAIKLQSCFSPGVIELSKTGKARLEDARYDSISRNVFLYPELKDRVKLGFKKDHCICTFLHTF
jgi:DNA-directed RNA polymerase I and III subunit RPAC1